MNGNITLNQYVAFLGQAYHHVKHTVPLLMACGARLPESYEWLRVAIGEYIEEETGHQEWILNDIAACGEDKEAVRAEQAHASTELMVAYAYDAINRVNPVCFFGMVHVLEGTSVTTATGAGQKIQQALQLPNQAFSYLFSHGSLDVEHIAFFEGLMNKIESPEDQKAIIHASKIFYGLYANVFRSLPERKVQNAA
jgi:pyrroloquinoline quinone (PQQ) biosynthesis protein C